MRCSNYIKLHGLRWQIEGYDKWDVLTIDLLRLAGRVKVMHEWIVLTIGLHEVYEHSIPIDKNVTVFCLTFQFNVFFSSIEP